MDELLERTEAALARLAEAGPVSELVARAPAEAVAATGLERVLLSRVEDGQLVPESVHGAPLPAPVAFAYPMIEGELLRRRRAAIAAERRAFADYALVAPVVIGGRTVGFFHGEGGGERQLDALARFARGFALLYELAVLHRRLRTQREALRQVASWADARSAELADGAIDLAHDRDTPVEGPPAAEPRLHERLTRRELDVLERMAEGASNAEIARGLVVSEGTVKFHVKNILRKLGVANRAEATAHFLRDSMRGR